MTAMSQRRVALPLAPGVVVNGRYAVEHILGLGSMGWVYAVRDGHRSERPVTLKVVSDLARSPELCERLAARLRIISELRHPNLAPLYGLERVEGTDDYAIVTERVAGVRIDEALAPWSEWPTVLAHVMPICRALAYIHGRSIVHGNLRPSNVLVAPDGTVRVVDCGIGRGVRKARHRSIGDLLYTAPEAVTGLNGFDHRSDLYSLGITLYELLAGVPPCVARSPEEIRAWSRTHRVELPGASGVPPWLSGLVSTLCAPEPTDRLESAEAVMDCIEASG